MSQSQNNNNSHHFKPQRFEIRIQEYIASDWSDWLDGFSVTHDTARQTILTGVIQDQSALHGLLARIRDLGLTLISVHQVSPEPMKEENSGRLDPDANTPLEDPT